MSRSSRISWTTSTWNPVTGCTPISKGCENCYAAAMARRFQAMGVSKYRNGFQVDTHECALEIPLHWRKPRFVFVNSMGDLFHEEVPLDFILRVFEVMRSSYWHVFQLLTKRAERLAELNERLDWPGNVWAGVTVESDEYLYRVDLLRRTAAHVKFISFEPLLGPIEHPALDGVDWAVVGGESGPKARPIRKEWVTSLRDYCAEKEIAFFFKQWGGRDKTANGRELDGRIWDEMPEPEFCLS